MKLAKAGLLLASTPLPALPDADVAHLSCRGLARQSLKNKCFGEMHDEIAAQEMQMYVGQGISVLLERFPHELNRQGFPLRC